MGKFGLDNENQRMAWISKQLQHLPAGVKLLDAGAGEQQYKKFCLHLEYVAQDFAEYDPKELSVGLQVPQFDYGQLDIVSDIIAIPREDQSFDALLCAEVLEHIPNPVLALQEFARLLKPQGKLILTAPFCSMTHFAPYHFCTGFSKYFYKHHLEDNGFTILECTPNGNYFSYLAQELYRLATMADKYTSSSLSAVTKLAIRSLIKTLQSLSKRDTGSDELLNFGYHILAEKK